MTIHSTQFPFESFDDVPPANTGIQPLPALDAVNTLTANENTPEIKPQAEMFPKEALENASKEAFDAGKAAGFAEGKTAALADINTAQEQLNKKILAALESLNIQLATLFSNAEQLSPSHFTGPIQQLALGIAKKITGNDIKENAVNDIETYINRSLALLFDQPALTIYLHPELEAPLTEKIKELVVKNNFRGEVLIKPDTTLAATDCRLDWKEGFSELSRAELWKSIEKALEAPQTKD